MDRHRAEVGGVRRPPPLRVLPAMLLAALSLSPAAPGQSQALLEPVVAENARLEQLLRGPEGLEGAPARLQAKLAETEQRHETLRASRERVEARVQAAGGTQSVGVILWRDRGRIGREVDEERAELEESQRLAGELQLQLIEFAEARDQLADPGAAAADIRADWPSAVPAADAEAASAALGPLLAQRATLLDSLAAAGAATLEVLVDLERHQLELVEEGEAYRAYVEEQSMWLRSATPVTDYGVRKLLSEASAALGWLLDPRHWASLLQALWRDARVNPGIVVGCLALIVLLLLARGGFQERLARAAGDVSRPETDTLGRSLGAALCTLLLAAPTPLLIWMLAWRLQSARGGSFEQAAGLACAFISGKLWLLQCARGVCRPNGLAERHFEWPDDVRQDVRRAARRLLSVWLPAIFVVAMLVGSGKPGYSESLGRAIFIAASIFLSVVLARALRVGGSAWRALERRGRTGWVWTFRHALRWMLVALPLVLAVLGAAGFYYTALALLRRLMATLALAGVLLVLQALVLRWLRLERRRMLTAKRALRLQAAAAGDNAATGSEEREAAELAEAADVDVKQLGSQTRRLANLALAVALLIGSWMIWVDVLPALSKLDEFVLWQQLSLMNVLRALLIGVALFVAAHNVRGLLEVSVLGRLPLSPPARYAVSSLASYVLMVAGIVGVFAALGVAWSDVQWLAAAATVGLGFGLQEIVANFVAGVILLLERPIRVGDTVTVGGVSGTVARSRMRATTITDGDRRELLVPNKEFITGQVVNWTLSDDVLRAVIKVGVAYGSDTDRVCSMLLQLGSHHPLVLAQPEPQVCFDTFGDSALNFELRVFVRSPDAQRIVRHDLNMAVERAFREAGIEVPFPQRDVHVRTPPSEESAGLSPRERKAR